MIMENIDIEKAKKLPIQKLYELKDFSESMIRVYTESTPNPDGVKRWQNKLKALNDIINDRVVHFQFPIDVSGVVCGQENPKRLSKTVTEVTCWDCAEKALKIIERAI